MDFYHSVTVLYGARVVTDDPHRTEYHALDLPAAEKVFDKYRVNHALHGGADEEEVYVYTVHEDLDTGESFHIAHDEDNADARKYPERNRIRACAQELGIEIDPIGWIAIHEYR